MSHVAFAVFMIIALVAAFVGRRNPKRGARVICGALFPLVILVSAWMPNRDFPSIPTFSTFGHPASVEELTPEGTLRFLQQYNQAIVQTVEATRKLEFAFCLRLLYLGMALGLSTQLLFHLSLRSSEGGPGHP